MAKSSLSLDNASIVLRVKESFTLWTTTVVPHMPRTARYAIGARIETHFLDLLEIIYQAYYAPLQKKTEYIILGISKTDMLRYLLQIAWENKQLA